jgi:endopolyphosphatase
MSEYALESVSVRTMMDLARRLMVDKKLWRRFVRRIYSESGYEP